MLAITSNIIHSVGIHLRPQASKNPAKPPNSIPIVWKLVKAPTNTTPIIMVAKAYSRFITVGSIPQYAASQYIGVGVAVGTGVTVGVLHGLAVTVGAIYGISSYVKILVFTVSV
jgi:hypothetical protein